MTLHLPAVLEVVVGHRHVTVQGATVSDALEAAFERLPALRYHLEDEHGDLRPHVLCLLNDSVLERTSLSKAALADGDSLRNHQAISGG